MLGRMNANGIEGAGHRQYFMERRGDGVPIIRRETKELTGKEPRFRLINGSELCLAIPAAEPDSGPATVVITVRRSGRPLEGGEVLALFPNKTWKRGGTDGDGEVRLELHSIHLPMTVFVAAEGCAAYVEREWLPTERSLAIELDELHGGGSVVFAEATGRVPGLAGRLNPILDTSNRDVSLCFQHRNQRRTATARVVRPGQGGVASHGRKRQRVAHTGGRDRRTVIAR